MKLMTKRLPDEAREFRAFSVGNLFEGLWNRLFIRRVFKHGGGRVRQWMGGVYENVTII